MYVFIWWTEFLLEEGTVGVTMTKNSSWQCWCILKYILDTEEKSSFYYFCSFLDFFFFLEWELEQVAFQLHSVSCVFCPSTIAPHTSRHYNEFIQIYSLTKTGLRGNPDSGCSKRMRTSCFLICSIFISLH